MPVHFLGRRVGRDVEILRREAEHQVAHRAADDVSLMAVAREDLADLAGPVAQALPVNPVRRDRDPLGLGPGPDAEHAADEAFDQLVEGKGSLGASDSNGYPERDSA